MILLYFANCCFEILITDSSLEIKSVQKIKLEALLVFKDAFTLLNFSCFCTKCSEKRLLSQSAYTYAKISSNFGSGRCELVQMSCGITVAQYKTIPAIGLIHLTATGPGNTDLALFDTNTLRKTKIEISNHSALQ